MNSGFSADSLGLLLLLHTGYRDRSLGGPVFWTRSWALQRRLNRSRCRLGLTGVSPRNYVRWSADAQGKEQLCQPISGSQPVAYLQGDVSPRFQAGGSHAKIPSPFFETQMPCNDAIAGITSQSLSLCV